MSGISPIQPTGPISNPDLTSAFNSLARSESEGDNKFNLQLKNFWVAFSENAI